MVEVETQLFPTTDMSKYDNFFIFSPRYLPSKVMMFQSLRSLSYKVILSTNQLNGVVSHQVFVQVHQRRSVKAISESVNGLHAYFADNEFVAIASSALSQQEFDLPENFPGNLVVTFPIYSGPQKFENFIAIHGPTDA